MGKVSYYWRLFATGLCFSSFGIGGLFLTLVVFPIIHILPTSSDMKVALIRSIIHLSFRFFVLLMQVIGVLKLEIQGHELLLRNKVSLIIANHPSLIDVIVLISLVKQTECVVKQGLWENPLLKGVVKAAGYISNSDPSGLITDCVAALENGRTLIIFPEGTRTVPGQPPKFQRGAANMAINTPVDITPIIIRATPNSLGKGDKWYQVPKHGRFHLSIQVAENINVTPFLEAQRTYKSIQVRRLNDYLQKYYYEALFAHE